MLKMWKLNEMESSCSSFILAIWLVYVKRENDLCEELDVKMKSVLGNYVVKILRDFNVGEKS